MDNPFINITGKKEESAESNPFSAILGKTSNIEPRKNTQNNPFSAIVTQNKPEDNPFKKILSNPMESFNAGVEGIKNVLELPFRPNVQNTFAKRTTQDLVSGGVGTTAETIGQGMQWLGNEKTGKKLESFGKGVQERYVVKNPTLYDEFVQSFGTSAPLMLGGIATGAGLGVAGVPAVISGTIAALGMAGIEGLQNAGATRARVLEKAQQEGKDPILAEKEANKAATKHFITAVPISAVLNKFGLFGGAKGYVSKLIKSFGGEATEEGQQQFFQNVYAKDPVMQGVVKSAIFGGIMGLGGGALEKFVEDSTGTNPLKKQGSEIPQGQEESVVEPSRKTVELPRTKEEYQSNISEISKVLGDKEKTEALGADQIANLNTLLKDNQDGLQEAIRKEEAQKSTAPAVTVENGKISIDLNAHIDEIVNKKLEEAGVKTSEIAPKTEEMTLYRGGGEGSMPKGKTAQEIINYEIEELGNKDIVPEKGIDLKSIKSDNLKWFTNTKQAAKEYGDVTENKGNYRVVARDSQGGVLVEPVKAEKPLAKTNEGEGKIDETSSEFLKKQSDLLQKIPIDKKIKEANITKVSPILRQATKEMIAGKINEQEAIDRVKVEFESLPKAEKPKFRETKINEIAKFNDNLNMLKEGKSSNANIGYLPESIAINRGIPKQIYIDGKIVQKIKEKHGLDVNGRFIENLNTAEDYIFPKNDTNKINIIKELGNNKYLIIATRRFDGHYVVTGFETGHKRYVDLLKQKGEVVNILEGSPNSLIAKPLLNDRRQQGLSVVKDSTSSPTDIIQNKSEVVKEKDKFREGTSNLSQSLKSVILKLNREIFGDDNVRMVMRIIENSKALGKYQDGMIEILDGNANAKDTFYHEAVHKYLDIFATKEERLAIYKYAKEKYRTTNKATTEEHIAEDFITYAENREGIWGKVQKIIDRIVLRIKKLLGKSTRIEQLYEDILGGKAKGKASLKTESEAMNREITDTSEFKEWFGDSKVVDEKGKPLVVYSGHSNMELYGNKYLPHKGTAGGFYASEDPKIASNYAMGKFGIKENYERGLEYRFADKKGNKTKKLWQVELTTEQENILNKMKYSPINEYEECAPIRDMDKWIKDNAPYDKNARRMQYTGGSNNLQNIHDFYEWSGYTLRHWEDSSSGKTEVERFRNSDFDDLLDTLGLKWSSYWKPSPGVMPVYLKIENPLDASKPFPHDLLKALKDKAKYEREKSEGLVSDHWTKEYSLKQWVKDIESGDEFWSTQIPSKAIPIIKSFGYDGVKELGLKGSGLARSERQINWIALESNQIKSATGNRGTFDAKNPDIRFRESESNKKTILQIAHSMKKEAVEEYKSKKAAQDKFFDDIGHVNVRYFADREEWRTVPAWVKQRINKANPAIQDLDEKAESMGMSDDELLQKLNKMERLEKPSFKLVDYLGKAKMDYEQGVEDGIYKDRPDLIAEIKREVEKRKISPQELKDMAREVYGKENFVGASITDLDMLLETVKTINPMEYRGEQRNTANKLKAYISQISAKLNIDKDEFTDMKMEMTGKPSLTRMTIEELEGLRDNLLGIKRDISSVLNKDLSYAGKLLDREGYKLVEKQARVMPDEVLTAIAEGKIRDMTRHQKGNFSTMGPDRAAGYQDGKEFGIMNKYAVRPLSEEKVKMYTERNKILKEFKEVTVFMNSSKATETFWHAEKRKRSTRKVYDNNGKAEIEEYTVPFHSNDPKVIKAAAWFRTKYDWLLGRLNEARAKIGKEPIAKRADYITHFQELNALDDILQGMGMDLVEVPNSMLAISMYTKPNSPYFKFAKARRTDLTSTDIRKAFSQYVEPALKTIYLSKYMHDFRDILEYRVEIKSEYEGSKPTKTSLFCMKYPNAYEYWTKYLNVLSGKRDIIDKVMPVELSYILGKTNRLFAAGSIGGNLSTAIVQPGSFANSVAELGLYAFKGHALLHTPKYYSMFRKYSEVKMGRQFEPFLDDDRLLGNKLLSQTVDKITKVISVPVSLMDREMVGGAWVGAYLKGREALHLPVKDALYYADSITKKTQASAALGDRPPINTGKIKVGMNQFGTFFYNQWQQLKTDIMGKMIHKENSAQGYDETGLGSIKVTQEEAFAKLLRYGITAVAMSALYDWAELPNPFKNEGLGKSKNEVLNWFIDHTLNVIPGVSTARFGGSPIIQAGNSIKMIFIPQNSTDKNQGFKALQKVGWRLMPGGGQSSKTLGGIEALNQGGRVVSGGKQHRYMFTIDTDDAFEVARALLLGKWQTKAGQDYLKKRNMSS